MGILVVIMLILCTGLGFLSAYLVFDNGNIGSACMLGFFNLFIIGIFSGKFSDREFNLERNGTEPADTIITIKNGIADTVVTYKIIYK